jgi:hypothetical protein
MGISRIVVLSLLCLFSCGKVNSGDQTKQADAAPAKVMLTVTVTGPGAVSSDPAGINCSPDCTTSVDQGTQVTLTPTAGVLASWSGGGCTGTDPCVVTMDADTSITATFASGLALTITPAGTGTGTVTSSPAGIACPPTCTANFAIGANVTVTQSTTDANTRVGGWSGGGCTANAPCIVKVDTAKTVTSYFDTMLIDSAPGATSTTDRTDGSAPGLSISAAAATTITELDGDIAPSAACQVKFVVFDATSLAALYISDPVNAPAGRSTVRSPAMSFAMVAGTKYQFVALTSVATTNFYDDFVGSTANGLTTYAMNGNATNYAAPTLPAPTAGADMHFQIWGH